MARPPKLTVAVRNRFLQRLLTNGGHVGDACTFIGVTRWACYKRRMKDPEFKQHWDDIKAAATDVIEDGLRARATQGVKRLKLFQGKPVMIKNPQTGVDEPLYEYEFSDTAAIALARAYRPDKFRDRTEHTGKDGGPIKTDGGPPIYLLAPDNGRRRGTPTHGRLDTTVSNIDSGSTEPENGSEDRTAAGTPD